MATKAGIDPQRMDEMLARGHLALKAGEYEEAEQIFGELLNGAPPNEDVLIGLAKVLRATNRGGIAIDLLQASQMERQSDAVLLELGQTFVEQEQMDHAERLLLPHIARLPQAAQILVNAYTLSGREEEANRLIRSTAEDKADNGEGSAAILKTAESTQDPKPSAVLSVAKVMNDAEVGEDELGVEDELRALARTIAMVEVRPPLVVGLMGSWGSGKSFAMHLIQKELAHIRAQPSGRRAGGGEGRDGSVVEYVGHPYTVFFNAWTFAKSELWASLMQEIFTQLETQVSLEDQLTKLNLDPEQGGPLWTELYSSHRDRFRHALERFAKHHPERAAEVMKIAAHQSNKLWDALSDKDEQEKLIRMEEARQKLEDQVGAKAKEFERLQEQRQQHLDQSLKEVEQRYEKRYTDLVGLLGESCNKFLGKDFDASHADFAQIVDDLKAVKGRFLQLRALWRDGRHAWPLWLGLLVVVFAAFEMSQFSFFHNWLDHVARGAMATLAPMLGTLLKFYRDKRGLLTKGLAELEKLGGELNSLKQLQARNEERIKAEKADIIARYDLESTGDTSHTAELAKTARTDLRKLQGELEKAQLELDRLAERTGVRRFTSLRSFLRTRLESGDYSSRLGLIHQVQRDLGDLSEALLNEDLRGKSGIFPRGEPRIVIFIDDLDRCPPDKVVDMLEAVQLLCKTQLFVVVLAVDMRYITRALEKEYEGILDPHNRPSGHDYVEKIIQIPYQMHLHSGDRLVNLLGRDVAEAELDRRDVAERVALEEAAEREQAAASSAPPALEKAPEALEPTQAQAMPADDVPDEIVSGPTRQAPGSSSGPLLDMLARARTTLGGLGSRILGPLSEGFAMDLDAAPAAPPAPAPVAAPTPAPVQAEAAASETVEAEKADRGVFLPTRKIEMTSLERELLAEMCAQCSLTPRSTKRMGNVFRLIKVVLLTARREWDESQMRLMIVMLVLSECQVEAMARLFRSYRPHLPSGHGTIGTWLESEHLPGSDILGDDICDKKLTDFDRNMVQLIRSFSFLDVGASIGLPNRESS